MVTPDPDLPSSRRAARRRHLTLLFCDLSDSTTLAGSVEPEYYLEVLDHLKRCAYTIVPKYGGTVVDFHGDGFLAMFGFPETSENDGRSATEAALELHEAIGRISTPFAGGGPLRMHSGIHSGLVLLIEDDTTAGRFSLVGEAPSIAARLSDYAARNEILVSATTLGTESHFFQIGERRELTLQGRTEPVAAYRVFGRGPISTRFEARTEHGLTHFAGRARELALLDRGLENAVSGELQVVSVVGGPGIGKTRLVEEFLHRAMARGCGIHRGYCEDHRSAEPLQPFRQMLRTLAPAPASHSPAAVRDLFSALSAARPLVVFIDDWQWADDASRQVLAAMRELLAHRILIVTTSRSTDYDAASSESEIRLLLAPLDQSDAAQTVRALLPAADPFLVRHIQELSGGNPLFIEELCHAASSEIVGRSSERAVGDPAWLSALIESRVGRLPAEQADLVRTAAIVGLVIPSWLLEQLSGYSEQDSIVRELAQRDLLFPGDTAGTLRFKHGITREVIYQSAGLRWRQEMHVRVAQLLEERYKVDGGDDLIESLAYHFRAGARRDRAAIYAERAGDKALALAALDRARTQYASALELLGTGEDDYARWIAIAQRFGLACVYDPARDQVPLLQRALELATARRDEAALARAHYWLGYVHYALGELTLAIEHCQEALALTARATATARAEGNAAVVVELEAHGVQVLATLGQARAAACDYDGVLEQLDEAIAIKRRHRRGGRPAVGSAYTLACRGAVLGDLGRFEEAHESFAEALDAVREGNQPVKGSILSWQGAVYAWQHRWADTLRLATEAQHIAERVESLYVLAINQALGGFARWKLERSTDAIDTMIRAVAWLESRDKLLFISVSYAWIAEALVETGRFAEARSYVARAIRRARRRDCLGEAMAYRAMARMPPRYRSRSPHHYLLRALASARARRSPHEEAVTLRQQADLAAAAGRGEEVLQLRARAQALFTAPGVD